MPCVCERMLKQAAHQHRFYILQESFSTGYLPTFWHAFQPVASSRQTLHDAGSEVLQLLVVNLQVRMESMPCQLYAEAWHGCVLLLLSICLQLEAETVQIACMSLHGRLLLT